MPLILTKHATEKSSYIITASFTDEDGDATVPKTVKWTLTNAQGTVVNSREDVVVAVPTAEIDILLSGDDLQILTGEVNEGIRLLTINATYDSKLASDVPLKGSIRFVVDNLRKVN